eukprot:352853-Chlamydomonas_euryale.AAC.7
MPMPTHLLAGNQDGNVAEATAAWMLMSSCPLAGSQDGSVSQATAAQMPIPTPTAWAARWLGHHCPDADAKYARQTAASTYGRRAADGNQCV